MKADWVTKVADRVEASVRQRKGEDATIVCASGISPSGPIHLGNLREPMTVHLVAEELRGRGWKVDHIHSWDDYDRLRKVPAGTPADFAQYIGMPYADIPDPFGEYDSYATRYISDFAAGLDRLGVHPRFVRQSEAYRRGDYVEQIKQAIRQRFEIFDILAEYQNLEGQKESVEDRRAAYYPFKTYCENCHKDMTHLTSYRDEDASFTYVCDNCGHESGYSLNDKVDGKLAWKIDWPMRWSYEQVDFEPGGEDHSSPGSSYTVGQRIVQLYNWKAPQFIGYAFVGMGGRSKISSSAGTTATVTSALNIIEPAILRWLYARRANNQAFEIDYGQGLLRLYEEWDALVRQIAKGAANESNQRLFERATRTVSEEILYTHHPVPFPLLTSVIDVTQANEEQVLRIISQTLPEVADGQVVLREQLEPRFTCALNWVNNYLPDDERTQIGEHFNSEAFAQFVEMDQASIRMLAERLDTSWNLHDLTSLMYSIPKIVRGMDIDTPPNDELKQAQRSFFVALYTLICGKDTGPRIPTLLLSIGLERAKQLLTPSVDEANEKKDQEMTIQ
ncbi:lysine--tRNA ligase [Dictyobacter arantiisoli]|uniref:Lysine--tRNA ligase n=1 Tax=Dictyobacter arantiisoli TaxID=2014874 RepID=A0A5A5T8S4_9CHLR|nr:lysine--tRNA ligase [Dictyobacter arantiisoli]GCF07747.1 lysine--tRNA ligase [Dictyobacter arantiisoli]